MKHKLFYDEENNVLMLEIVGEYTYEDAKETIRMSRDSYNDKSPYPLLVDLSNTEMNIDRVTRRFLQDQVKKLGITRMALVVSNPVIRMTAKILASASGKANESGFFKTKEEAIIWLKGEM